MPNAKHYFQLQQRKKLEEEERIKAEKAIIANFRREIFTDFADAENYTECGCELRRDHFDHQIFYDVQVMNICKQFSTNGYRFAFKKEKTKSMVLRMVYITCTVRDPASEMDVYYQYQLDAMQLHEDAIVEHDILYLEYEARIARFDAGDEPFIRSEARRSLDNIVTMDTVWGPRGVVVHWDHEPSYEIFKDELQQICAKELGDDEYMYVVTTHTPPRSVLVSVLERQ